MNTITSVNLFRYRKKGLIEKFVAWALSLGRIVVIITETVALAAFLYRFSLDWQLVDLHDEIKHKQSLVSAAKKNEDIYRNLQNRLDTIALLDLQNKKVFSLIQEINSLAKQDFIINSLIYSSSHVKVDITARSISTITNFVKVLRSNTAITNVSLDRIENKTSTGTILVTITAALAQGK